MTKPRSVYGAEPASLPGSRLPDTRRMRLLPSELTKKSPPPAYSDTIATGMPSACGAWIPGVVSKWTRTTEPGDEWVGDEGGTVLSGEIRGHG